MSVTVSAILAMAQNRVIGKDNKLPWHLPADLKFFKATTMGKPIIMGRKCYESLGRPLPGRLNIVVSRSYQNLSDIPAANMGNDAKILSDKSDTKTPDNLLLMSSLEDAIAKAKDVAAQEGKDEIFIIGGAQIYQAALPLTDKLYMTVIHKDFEGDISLPQEYLDAWQETWREDHEEELFYSFLTLKKTA